jgi:flagellar hook protein FlgE
MGISSSMNAGVSGLNANANKLATISDNIANSQTFGYKRADVDFASMTVSDSKSPNTTGGGRWFTAGGVRTNAIWDIELGETSANKHCNTQSLWTSRRSIW